MLDLAVARGIGHPPEEPLLAALSAHGLNRADAPVFAQSFEVGNLRWLHTQTPVRLVQLVATEGAPAERPDTFYAALTAPDGLAAIEHYASGIGPDKALVLARDADGAICQGRSGRRSRRVWTACPPIVPAWRRGFEMG